MFLLVVVVVVVVVIVVVVVAVVIVVGYSCMLLEFFSLSLTLVLVDFISLLIYKMPKIIFQFQ